MITAIKRVFPFLIILVMTLTLVSEALKFGVKRVRIDQIGKINAIATHEIDPEIIIFGSSVSEVSIDPNIIQKLTGKTCYNASLNGTSFIQYRGLIDEFNTYSKKNKIVVMSEAYFSFSNRNALTDPDYYIAQLNHDKISGPLAGIDNELIWKSKYIPYYRFIASTNRYYKYAFLGWKDYLKQQNGHDPLKGYAPVNREWEKDADEAIERAGKFTIEIDESVLQLYINQIKDLQRKGHQVVIILTPIYKAALAKATSIEPLYKALRRISSSTGTTFFDFSNSALAEHKRNFYNSNHLNLKGSISFSKQLADSLILLKSRN